MSITFISGSFFYQCIAMSWPLFTLFMVFFISIGSQCLPWPFLKVPSYVISTSEFTNGTKAGVHHRPLPCPWFLTFQKSTSSGLNICGAFYSCFLKGSQKVTVQTLFPEWLSGQVSLTIMLVTLTITVMVTIPDPRSPSPALRVTHRPPIHYLLSSFSQTALNFE